ncbi:putative uncharacterized protein [Prevotella sp. CAG:474]|nr:putative uncharacterized protein [Prevotella sp. CAG:474]
MYTDCDVINAINTAKKDGYAEGYAKGFAEGFVEGFAEGIKFRKVEIARKMLRRGIEAEEVAEVVDMTIQEIKEMM